MRSHEAGRIVFGVVLRPLYGKMYLVFAEPFVDGIDGAHQAFLTRVLIRRLRGKEV